MPSVRVFNDNFDKAMRRFKKKVESEQILEKVRSKMYYEKPFEKRNRKKAAAIGRRKKADREAGKPTRFY